MGVVNVLDCFYCFHEKKELLTLRMSRDNGPDTDVASLSALAATKKANSRKVLGSTDVVSSSSSVGPHSHPESSLEWLQDRTWQM